MELIDKATINSQQEVTMPQAVQGILTVAGRILLALIFLMSTAGNKIPNFSAVTQIMKNQGIPMPQVMLVGAIVFLIAGSLSIIVGYQARIGATLLFVFLVLATYFFHDFWTWTEEAMWVLNSNSEMKMPVQKTEMVAFMKNLALMGAMLLLIANGSGPMSLDARLAINETK